MLSLLPVEIKLKAALTFRNYRMPYTYLPLWLLLKSWGIISLTFWKLKEIISLTFPFKNATLKWSRSQISVMVQRNSPPDDNLEKLTTDTQQ